MVHPYIIMPGRKGQSCLVYSPKTPPSHVLARLDSTLDCFVTKIELNWHQKQLNHIVGSIYKTILPTSKSFPLIMSQMCFNINISDILNRTFSQIWKYPNLILYSYQHSIHSIIVYRQCGPLSVTLRLILLASLITLWPCTTDKLYQLSIGLHFWTDLDKHQSLSLWKLRDSSHHVDVCLMALTPSDLVITMSVWFNFCDKTIKCAVQP